MEDCFVGKKKELNQLVHLLLDDEKEHRVVSIWGMGGIGKTTIARKLYNHSKIKRSFDSFAWVCITQQCQVRSVLEDILSQLNPHKRGRILSLRDGQLIGQLCEIQKAKRCMIVVDDIWQIDHWDGLSHAFVMQGLKTRILLTARKQDVANLGFAFEIGLLNINDGWELLKGKAFTYGTISGTKTRHLAIRYGKRVDAQHGEITSTTIQDSLKQVRSLQFHNDTRGKKIEFPHSIIDVTKCKLLRVLVFKRFKFVGGKLPRGFGNLIHLRYLSFQQCELDELPSSISNMAYLYTLDLLYSWNVRIPSVLTRMTRLKHLFLPSYNIGNIGKHRLTLFGFNSLVHELKSISRMKNLRHFEAKIHDNESLSEILNAIASNWKDLRFCSIDINHLCKFISVEEGSTILENLFTCPNLFNFRINVEIGKLLQERATQIVRSTVVRLSLFGCEIEEDPMEIFGKFPFLEDLCLLERSYVGEVMKCHAFHFPRLKNLVLKGLPNLRELRVEEGVMPIISKVHMNGCSGLDMIPDGFRFIHTLEKLTITRMPKLANRVYDGADDFDKVSHVTSIFIIGD